MALDQKDAEIIERIIYKNADDLCVSIARSFERVEERLDSIESRVHARIADSEDKIESARQDIEDNIESLRDALSG